MGGKGEKRNEPNLYVRGASSVRVPLSSLLLCVFIMYSFNISDDRVVFWPEGKEEATGKTKRHAIKKRKG